MNIYFGAIAEKTRAPVAWLKTCAPKKSPIHSTRARACFHLHPRSPPALSTASQSSHPLCACFRLHPRPPLGASGMRLQPWMHDPALDAWAAPPPTSSSIHQLHPQLSLHPFTPAPSSHLKLRPASTSFRPTANPWKAPSGCQIRGAQVCKST
jgi:hypothetical protein